MISVKLGDLDKKTIIPSRQGENKNPYPEEEWKVTDTRKMLE